jgi:biotin carboxylase
VTASTIGRLAVFFDANAVPIMEAFENSRDLCRILWVVGWSPDQTSHRLLSRFGDVVDVTEMDQEEAASHIVAAEPDGVVVFNDAPIVLAAEVASRLGLPFHSRSTARLLTDKLAQRLAFEEAGLWVPGHAGVRINDVDVSVPFPAVLKPRSGAGSRDTYLVESLDQVHNRLLEMDSSEEFILEEWLADRPKKSELFSDIVSVESVVRGNAQDHVIVTGRFPFAPPFRETGSFMPSDLAPDVRDDVCALAGAAINALGIQSGIVHTEIKVTPSGPRIIEVNGRLGGGISQLISRIGGPSMKVWAMRLALGLDIGSIPTFEKSPVAFFLFLVPPTSATRFVESSGLEELSKLTGVDEVHLKLQPGQAVDYRHGSWTEHAVQIDGLVSDHAGLLRLTDEMIPPTLHLTWDND